MVKVFRKPHTRLSGVGPIVANWPDPAIPCPGQAQAEEGPFDRRKQSKGIAMPRRNSAASKHRGASKGAARRATAKAPAARARKR